MSQKVQRAFICFGRVLPILIVVEGMPVMGHLMKAYS